MAAAPHLFDDPIASPELALVDAELAAQLRADLATGDPFRPRDVPRAEYPTLVFEAVVQDLAVDEVDVPMDEVPLVEELVELVDEPVPQNELSAPSVLEPIAPPEEQSLELPAYVANTVDELPAYVVRPVDERAAALPEYVVAPVELAVVDELGADIALGEDVMRPYVVEAPAELSTSSDYPVLPDLDERSDALEETEAALRRIREQLVPPAESKRRPRLRRRFTFVACLCAMTAAGVAAADVQLGLAHGWLGF